MAKAIVLPNCDPPSPGSCSPEQWLTDNAARITAAGLARNDPNEAITVMARRTILDCRLASFLLPLRTVFLSEGGRLK